MRLTGFSSPTFASQAQRSQPQRNATTPPGVHFGGSGAQTVTDANFQTEVIDASQNQTVLVDFYADWCPPCQQLLPRVDQAANAFAGKAKVVKYNVDPNQTHKIQLKGAARQYSIFKIPTLLVFKNGQVMERSIGAIPQNDLDDLITRNTP